MLNNDGKQFGKQHMFDGSEETCWNSDQVHFILHSLHAFFFAVIPQGVPQFIRIKFERAVTVSAVHIQFQGGFVGQTAEFSIAKPGEKVEAFTTFEPQDKNDVQVALLFFF